MLPNVRSYFIPSQLLDIPTVHPHPLPVLQTPPPHLTPVGRFQENPLATPFIGEFLRSKHIIHAAYPRTYNYYAKAQEYSQLDPIEPKETCKIRLTAMAASLVETKRAEEKGEIPPNPQESPVLMMEVERFSRITVAKSTSPGLTLVFAHASGFHKEIWDTTIQQLLLSEIGDGSSYSPRIEEIWTLDAVNHGGSALLNKDKLGDILNWSENARDIINFLGCYLPSQPQASLPGLLPRVSDEESNLRLTRGFLSRNVIGIGHSFGGCSLARAAAEYGSLWSSVILVDPVIVPSLHADPSRRIDRLVRGALVRRSRWNSRAEALEMLRGNPFFASWDPRVLDSYINDGMAADTKGNISLKTTSFQEAVTFCERQVCFETWELLDQVDPAVSIHWILSGKPPVVTGDESVTALTVWRRRKNSSNVRVMAAGHLVAQEAPDALAMEIWSFLKEKYQRADSMAGRAQRALL